MSECRDLLFHVQERRLTLPEIKSFIAENGLRFIGFEFAPQLMQYYRNVFGESLLPRALVNSAGTALLTTAIATALGISGAYALARLPVPGRRSVMLASNPPISPTNGCRSIFRRRAQ